MTVLVVLLVSWGSPAIPSQTKTFHPLRAMNTALWAESTHSYDVRHYRLDFDLPMTNAGYTCHEQVALASRVASLDTFSLDFSSLVCDSVKRDGNRLNFTTPSGLLHIELDAPLPQRESTVIDVFFRRESTVQQIGYFFGKPPQTRYAHAMTCGCPTDNHYWFACWDLPMDKAERGVCLNLTVPDTFQTCSNGLCDSVTTSPGKKTYWWRHPYPIATYLMTFSASRFASWDTSFANTNGETIPIIHWMWPEDSAASREGYRRLPEMMDYYIDTLVYGPYPFEKFGHVPGYFGFPWGGMEHQTLVMLHPSYIGGGHDVTIAHELSHMWWGDMVTHVGYADVWLNEGFATYSECICMGALNGRSYFNTLMRARAGSYFSSDRGRRMPVYNPPWELIYEYGHIYCKGAWVQHMLRWVLGDTAFDRPGIFFRGMRAYADSFPYGTVSTEDYKRVQEQVSGLELDWFFDEWIYQAGYPKYHLLWSREQVGDSSRVVVNLAQNNGSQAPDFFRTPLPVRINCLYVDTTVVIRPTANPQVDTFIVANCAESLNVDPDNWILDSAYVTSTGIAEAGHGLAVPRRISVSPNPTARPVLFELTPHAGPATILVSDEAGRLVREVVVRPTSRTGRTPGRTQAFWDLVDSQGKSVPAGVYFCHLAGSGTTVKLVLLDR